MIFVWQRYSEISDINHSAKLPYCPTWGQISSNWYELADIADMNLGKGLVWGFLVCPLDIKPEFLEQDS